MKDTILESYVKSFSEEFGLEAINLDEIFEHFVNYNLISKQYPRNFNFEDASVGSSNDTGIDGCAIIVNGNFVSSPEEVQELVKEMDIWMWFLTLFNQNPQINLRVIR